MNPHLLTVVEIAILVLSLLGLALVVAGLIGRRVGSEPRCRKCSYDLSGLVLEYCPECGSAASVTNVVIGRRVRRRTALVVGALLMLPCLAICAIAIVSWAGAFDFYEHSPTRLLLYQAAKDDRAAIVELTRRASSSSLSRGANRRVISLALSKHETRPDAANLDVWASLLGILFTQGCLGSNEQERFYRRLLDITVDVRPRIRPWDWVVLKLSCTDRGAIQTSLSYVVRGERLRIGQQNVRMPLHMGGRLSGGGTKAVLGFERPRWLATGVHPFEYTAVISLFRAGANTADEDPISSTQRKVSGEIEFVPFNEPDPIQLVADPQLTQTIRDAITIGRMSLPSWNMPGPRRIGVDVDLKGPLPVDLAFSVYAVGEDGRERDIGDACLAKGVAEQSTRLLGVRADLLPGKEATLIFRSSREAASQTLSCYEVWQGELVFDGIPIVRKEE